MENKILGNNEDFKETADLILEEYNAAVSGLRALTKNLTSSVKKSFKKQPGKAERRKEIQKEINDDILNMFDEARTLYMARDENFLYDVPGVKGYFAKNTGELYNAISQVKLLNAAIKTNFLKMEDIKDITLINVNNVLDVKDEENIINRSDFSMMYSKKNNSVRFKLKDEENSVFTIRNNSAFFVYNNEQSPYPNISLSFYGDNMFSVSVLDDKAYPVLNMDAQISEEALRFAFSEIKKINEKAAEQFEDLFVKFETEFPEIEKNFYSVLSDKLEHEMNRQTNNEKDIYDVDDITKW